MNIKRVALAVSLCFVAGCGSNSIKPSKDASSEDLKPKPISTIFKQKETEAMVVTFDINGDLESLTVKGYSTQNGNNNVSKENAKLIAELDAKRRVSEFFGNETKVNRTGKMISKAIQTAKMNTLEGQVDGPVVIETENFDENGMPKIESLAIPAGYPKDNTNNEKIDGYYEQVVNISAKNMIRGMTCSEYEVNEETRQVTATCGISTRTIDGAKSWAQRSK